MPLLCVRLHLPSQPSASLTRTFATFAPKLGGAQQKWGSGGAPRLQLEILTGYMPWVAQGCLAAVLSGPQLLGLASLVVRFKLAAKSGPLRCAAMMAATM